MAYKVFLDPGHGGRDPGAVGQYSTREKDVNLAVGLLLRDILVQHGLEVMLSRESDILPYYPDDLRVDTLMRGEKATDFGATVMLSIHCNGANSSTANGAEVWRRKTLLSANNSNGEATLATRLLEGFLAKTKFVNRGIKQEDFMQFTRARMYSCLVEMGFISNAAEETLLATPAFQRELAQGLAEGILTFLGVPILPEPAQDDVLIVVDGKVISTYARIVDGRTLVPIRFAEQLGYSVHWDAETRTVYLAKL